MRAEYMIAVAIMKLRWLGTCVGSAGEILQKGPKSPRETDVAATTNHEQSSLHRYSPRANNFAHSDTKPAVYALWGRISLFRQHRCEI
jgi:hypothetical protein